MTPKIAATRGAIMATDLQEREPLTSENVGNGIPTTHDERVARAERILSGDVRPEDYLPVTDEIESAVQEYVALVMRNNPRIIRSDEGDNNVRKNFTIMFHCGGKEVLAREDDIGVIVLAMGTPDVIRLEKQLTPKSWQGFGLDFPTRWSDES